MNFQTTISTVYSKLCQTSKVGRFAKIVKTKRPILDVRPECGFEFLGEFLSVKYIF